MFLKMLLSMFSLFMLMVGNSRGEVGDPPADDKDKVKDPEAVLAKNKELLEKLAAEKLEKDALKKQIKDQEEKNLKEKEDYKALYEKEKKDNETLAASLKSQQENLAKGAKLSEAKKELLKLGINPDRVDAAMRLVAIDTIKFDDATKTVVGAEIEAAKLKMLMPELFSQKDPEKLPHDPPSDKVPQEMSDEWYNKLPAADRKKHYREYMKQKGIEIRD